MLWGVCELMPEIMTAAGSGQEFLCIRMVSPACFQVLLTSYAWHLGLLCPGGRRIPEQHGGDLKMQVNMKNSLVLGFPVWLIRWNLLESNVPRFSFGSLDFCEVRLVVGSSCAVARGILPISEFSTESEAQTTNEILYSILKTGVVVWTYELEP